MQDQIDIQSGDGISVLGVFQGWSWWWSHSQGQVGAESSRVLSAVMWWEGDHCIVMLWKWKPVLLSIVIFLVCVELQKFDYFFFFFSLPTIQIFPYWRKHEVCCVCLVFSVLDFFLLPSPCLWDRSTLCSLPHPRKLYPGYLQEEMPSAEDPKDVARLPPGCTSGVGAALASPFHQHQGLKEQSAFQLSSSPARCLTAVSEELLFSCAFLPLTLACCSLSAFLALLLPREQGLNLLARWLQTRFKYTYICYIGSSSSILFVTGQDKTPHWDWNWVREGLQLRAACDV